MTMRITDRIIQGMLFRPVPTYQETHLTAGETELFCKECTNHIDEYHKQDCQLSIIHDFLYNNEYTIQKMIELSYIPRPPFTSQPPLQI